MLRFSGEALRQAGILMVSSTLVIWGLVFIVGLQCGIEGAYLLRAQGAPQYAGVFSAWCDLRELTPLVFGYMMAAKVGTGIVAELGSMRISEEIDALEVMGISGITFSARPGCSPPGSCCCSSTWAGSSGGSSPATWRSCTRSAACPPGATR